MHQLIVAGDGPSRNELQARCPNAIFMGCTAARRDARGARIRRSLCLPERSGSTNLGVLEAQASGLPVVVMEGGSARERVADTTARRVPLVMPISSSKPQRSSGPTRAEKRWGIAARKYAMQPGLERMD